VWSKMVGLNDPVPVPVPTTCRIAAAYVARAWRA
jgi:hypothetical protein